MSHVRVFISSRCSDQFDGAPLSNHREAIKARIEGITIADEPVFSVFLNEETPGEDLAQTWRTRCLSRVRRASIVLVLFNGCAGTADAGTNGICHDEFLVAAHTSPDTMRMIQLGEDLPALGHGADGAKADRKAARERDARFRKDIGRYLRGRVALDGETLLTKVEEELRDALTSLARLGELRARTNPFHSGPALDWRRMPYEERAGAMRATVADFLEKQLLAAGAPSIDSAALVAVAQRVGLTARVAPLPADAPPAPVNRPEADDSDEPETLSVDTVAGFALFVCGAVPDLFGVAAAREMLGQPFTQDVGLMVAAQKSESWGDDVFGPVHLVACHQGVTQTQAQKVLGRTDVIVVPAPFGVFAADPQSRVQMAFLSQCRDDGATRDRCRQLFEWLGESGEGLDVIARGRTRRSLLAMMAVDDRRNDDEVVVNGG